MSSSGHQYESQIELRPVSRDDISRLAEIHVVACAPDNAISLYFPNQKDFYSPVVGMLGQQIGDDSWSHIKAVKSDTGESLLGPPWYEQHTVLSGILNTTGPCTAVHTPTKGARILM